MPEECHEYSVLLLLFIAGNLEFGMEYHTHESLGLSYIIRLCTDKNFPRESFLYCLINNEMHISRR